ncbi:enoyl-CoA hydratase-related protein [Algoriphagus sp. C2-6-M1]|uniref:enoyl-CoA hydratase/isomerase family protein n=1 Tax=Algoriphagus persicinus TaxID=3108754 RepID=UPI002B39A5C3|nr:enoyl-CoA hydratase-related protein [Algoriphagus sp. C2-6-M1]MEB2781376.1 enoyl-CoA hydratase-related protein [Algoriphagus sp. C2-6-M1]
MSAVLTEITDRIGIITLNRPEKRNALSPELIAGLQRAFDDMNSDDEVKIIVLRSTGKAFCAGADLAYLQQLQSFSYQENLEDSRRLMSLFKLIYCLPKVVIAEIQGHALAGGCGLATVCDFAFAVPDALFGYTEVRIGFVPALVSVFLQEQIGAAKTQELLLSGEFISASKAAELGLITGVESSEFLEKYVSDFASKLITQNSSFSMGKTKVLLRELNQENRNKSLELAAEMNANARTHEDCKKGIAAFLNKNTPDW